jgi:hypothetical protein
VACDPLRIHPWAGSTGRLVCRPNSGRRTSGTGRHGSNWDGSSALVTGTTVPPGQPDWKLSGRCRSRSREST